MLSRDPVRAFPFCLGFLFVYFCYLVLVLSTRLSSLLLLKRGERHRPKCKSTPSVQVRHASFSTAPCSVAPRPARSADMQRESSKRPRSQTSSDTECGRQHATAPLTACAECKPCECRSERARAERRSCVRPPSYRTSRCPRRRSIQPGPLLQNSEARSRAKPCRPTMTSGERSNTSTTAPRHRLHSSPSPEWPVVQVPRACPSAWTSSGCQTHPDVPLHREHRCVRRPANIRIHGHIVFAA